MGLTFETPKYWTWGLELCVKVWPRDRNLGVKVPCGVWVTSEERRGPGVGPGRISLFVVYLGIGPRNGQECPGQLNYLNDWISLNDWLFII